MSWETERRIRYLGSVAACTGLAFLITNSALLPWKTQLLAVVLATAVGLLWFRRRP